MSFTLRLLSFCCAVDPVSRRLPDAYERLIFDVMRSDKRNFVRTGEFFCLAVKWVEKSSCRVSGASPSGFSKGDTSHPAVGWFRQERFHCLGVSPTIHWAIAP